MITSCTVIQVRVSIAVKRMGNWVNYPLFLPLSGPLLPRTSLSFFYLFRVFVVLFDDLLSSITFLSIDVGRVICCSSANLPVAV